MKNVTYTIENSLIKKELIIEKNKITDVSILCRAHLALALANTVKGNIVLWISINISPLC